MSFSSRLHFYASAGYSSHTSGTSTPSTSQVDQDEHPSICSTSTTSEPIPDPELLLTPRTSTSSSMATSLTGSVSPDLVGMGSVVGPSHDRTRSRRAHLPALPDALVAFASVAIAEQRPSVTSAAVHARSDSQTTVSEAGGEDVETLSVRSNGDWEGPSSEANPGGNAEGVVTSPAESANAGPKCSYTSLCSTGSPLRKVVSHIFGRNKLCTRQIPPGVWVHYCRKHYQRSRYRNPKGFALLQCDLVRKQVDRLQLWGGVVDWTIKVRKREEIRLGKELAERLARASKTMDIDGRGDETEDENTPDAFSTWMSQNVGSSKSATDVMAILYRIENQISEHGSGFPDIEILPCLRGSKIQTRPTLFAPAPGTYLREDHRGAGVRARRMKRKNAPGASQPAEGERAGSGVGGIKRPRVAGGSGA
ncbi:MAG: hypothetical protein M1838_006229 [Thelocarpon superellum]|nr:MAG: hypothetical protein M1838_006229 [Thelocarpon superellum]